MPFTAPEPSNRRPRIVGDAVVIGKSTIIARRYVLHGVWEVEKHHPVALSRLLSMAYGKRISSGGDMVKLLEKAAAALPRNPREADQLISGLPEPLAEAEERIEEANRLLKDGVSPYRLAEAMRGEKLGLSPAPAWTEHLTLCDKGIVLGKGTVIVTLTDDGLDLEGKEAEVLALLSLARRCLAPPETLEKLASVSRAMMAGNISVAAISLAQLGQPPLQDEYLAKSLTFAANKLKRGVKPLELLKKAGFSRATLEKAYGKSISFNEDIHPRDEKGKFTFSDMSTPAATRETEGNHNENTGSEPRSPNKNDNGEEKKPAVSLSVGKDGQKFLIQQEGTEFKQYPDTAGIPTIGYGHKLLPGESYPNGITEEQAQALLDKDINTSEQAVRGAAKVPLTQEQYDALISFSYNIGAGAFKNSTLVKKLNEGDYEGAANELLRWNKVTKNGVKIVDKGLDLRRQRERNLFLHGAYK
ncbi:MAG TPA: lysozyme [Candidatus Sulfotelmatobacter sp.]|nr:lysozyme [Candidatus Sulfotelmatobacter sp.]